MACEGHHVGLTCLSTWKYWDTRGNQKSYLCEIPNILREIVKRSQRFTVELQNYLLEKFGSNQGGKANSPWLWSVVIWLFPKDGENGLRLPEMPWGSWSGVMTCMFDAVLLDVCVCALSRSWLFETPWAVACQAPLSMEFSRQGYWSWLPFPPPGDRPDSGIEAASLVSLALIGDSLPLVLLDIRWCPSNTSSPSRKSEATFRALGMYKHRGSTVSMSRALQRQGDRCWGSGSGSGSIANHFSVAKPAAVKPGCQIMEGKSVNECKNIKWGDFPGDPVVNIPGFQFNPWSEY